MRWSTLFIILLAACAGSGTVTEAPIGDISTTIDTVQVNGPLRLEARDMPASAAVPPFGPPSITATAGAIAVAKTQFGSLCQYALTGNADIRSSTIGLHIVFASRLTVCTADVRVLQYLATVTTAPGTYEVAVVHELNGVQDTLARQSVTVR